MSDYKVPRAFKFVDDFPRNGTDKVRKSELAALFTLNADRDPDRPNGQPHTGTPPVTVAPTS
jgi:acyl-coenzyme A synthetase/AMP-(fatty) acid ligase